MSQKEPDKDLNILECTINMLEDGEVIVPYPNSLTKALDATMLRSRGDYDKVMSLIKLRAWYHQRQRQCLTTPDGTKIWVATPEDGIACLKLASKAMRRWRTQLDERLIEALPHIKKLVHEPVPIGKDESEVVYGVTANKLAKKMRISDQTARNYLNTMAERGVLTYTQPKGRLKVYEFIVSEEEIEKKLEVTSVEPIEITLACEFEKETEEFLKGYYSKRKVEVKGEKVEESETTTPQLLISDITEKPETVPKEEKNPQTTSIQTKAIYRKVKPAEPCEQCGEHPVEYEAQLEEGSVLRRCPSCFQKLRSLLRGVEFVEKDEDQNKRGSMFKW